MSLFFRLLRLHQKNDAPPHTRACEIIIRNCSSAQPLTLKTFAYCPAWLRVVLFLGLRCRQITAPPASLHVRTFVTACLHSSLYHVFAQGHKRRRSARHTLNAGVTKAGQPRANRIPLLYPCYTLTPLCVCLLQDDYIIRSFFHSIGYYPKFFDTKRCVFKIVRGTRRGYSLWTPGRDG